MTHATISKLTVLDLLIKYNHEVTDEIIEDVTKLIESQLDVKLTHPISSKLYTDIKAKLITLKSAWSKLSTDVYKEMFRKEMSRRSFKIKLPAADLTDESMVARLEVIEERYVETKADNTKLEKTIKELNAELDELKAKLNHTSFNLTLETNKHASIKALETIAQAEQVSAMATIELQAKLNGKQKTIRNIITEPDILEILDGKQPTLSTSFPGTETINASRLASSSNFTSFLFETRKRLELEKLKAENMKNKTEVSKITKFKKRENFYLVSARQKARIKSQIKGLNTNFFLLCT